MRCIVCIAIAVFGIGLSWRGIYPPKKGKCPFREGVERKLTEHKGIVVGPGESTVDVCGTDSVVMSATGGRVTDVLSIQSMIYVRIQIDTLVYTYADIDRSLVREGQLVKAGQPIAIARQGRIEFFVSNYLGRIFRHPEEYVDCVCELPKAPGEN